MDAIPKIRRTALVYLSQRSGEYYLTGDPGYFVQRRPALGLQYLCAVLEKKGIKADIFDQTVFNFNLSWLIQKLKEDNYDIVGFYSSDAQEEKIKTYCRKISEALKIHILVGGPSTLTNTTFLDYGCEIVVHGEGEITIQQIVDYYNGVLSIQDVNGISYKENGKTVTNEPQRLIENLDELPFPDRSKVDINAYYDFFLFGMKLPYTAMITSRGCLYSCYFCVSYKIWGCQYRRRSVENVISEIDEAVKRYNIRYISFHDDLFITSNVWIEHFCERLIRKKYKIRWIATLHPFSIASRREDILRLMKDAGCDALSFGLQSAHPEILRGINRNPHEPERLKELLKLADKLNILTIVFYIFGLPKDTKKTIGTTINYGLSCGSTLAYYFTLSQLRGSELERLHRDRKVCTLSQEEIEKLAVYASRRFYSSPNNILKIASFILKNPAWLIKTVERLPYILSRVGITKIRKDTF